MLVIESIGETLTIITDMLSLTPSYSAVTQSNNHHCSHVNKISIHGNETEKDIFKQFDTKKMVILPNIFDSKAMSFTHVRTQLTIKIPFINISKSKVTHNRSFIYSVMTPKPLRNL